MEKRRFGRTAHQSTVAIFGGAAFWGVTQERADASMERVIASGVNHIDVAPSYGVAEERLGPWIARDRSRFFLGCKTTERSKEGASAELHQSLVRLQTSKFDLYQLHAVNTLQELDAAIAPDGALEAVREARDQGLVDYIGITGHGLEAPTIFREALQRFDFDTVLFPLSFILFANPSYRDNALALLGECQARNVGVMVIKTVAKQPWGDRAHKYTTWYEPFDDLESIQRAVNFALSQTVTGLCTPGDINVLPLCLDACEHWMRLSESGQNDLIKLGSEYEPLFSTQETS